MSQTVIVKDNYVAGRSAGVQQVRLRFANTDDLTGAGVQNTFDIVKNSDGDFADSKPRFSINPDEDTSHAGTMSYLKGSIRKDFLSVNATGTSSLTADYVNATTFGVQNLQAKYAVIGDLLVTGTITADTVIYANETVTLQITSLSILARDLTLTGSATMADLTVGTQATLKALTVTGATILKDTLAGATNGADLNGYAHISGAATLDNTLAVAGASTLSGSLKVNSAATMGSTLKVVGALDGSDATFSGIVTAGALFVTGAATATSLNIVTLASAQNIIAGDNITAGAQISANTLIVGSKATIEELEVKGDLYASKLEATTVAQVATLVVTGTAFMHDNLTAKKDLLVTGNATLAAGLLVSGIATAGNDLYVTGKVSASSTLYAGGAATFASSLGVTGNANLYADLNVSQAATITGAMSVFGKSTLYDNITVTTNASLSVSGATILGTTLDVNGQATLHAKLNFVDGANNTAAIYLAPSEFNTTGPASALYVDSDTIINNDLKVEGAGNFGATLEVHGDITGHNDLWIQCPDNTNIVDIRASVFSMYGGGTLAKPRAQLEADDAQATMILYKTDSFDFMGSLAITAGNMSLAHTREIDISAPIVKIAGATSVTGAAYISSAITAASSLDVTGPSRLWGLAQVSGALTVTGATTLAGGLTVTGNAQFDDLTVRNITASAHLRVLTGADIAGNVVLSSTDGGYSNTLYVTQETALIPAGPGGKEDTLHIAKQIFADSSLDVAGRVLVHESFTATNSATVYGGATVYGKTTLAVTNDQVLNLNAVGVDGTSGSSLVIDNHNLTFHRTAMNGAQSTIFADDTTFQASVGSTIDLRAPNLRFTGTTILATAAVTITGSLNVTGDVGGNSFATWSDARLKKDVETIEEALAKVKSLRGVEYNWNDRESFNAGRKEIGFIAQEVEAVAPQLVKTEAGEEGLKRVAYDRVVALLVEAIKSQAATIERLEARIAALESRA